MRRLILPFAFATASAALAACGQKGDLTYPPPPPANATAKPQPATPVMTPAPSSTSQTPFNPLIHP